MKKTLKSVHRPARRVLAIGWMSVALIVAVSTVLYIGAGTVFDYYSATEVSEYLLALSRPVAVAVCVISLLIEYRSKQKKSSSD